jgi:hypothetical protein
VAARRREARIALNRGEVLGATSALVLLILMFAARWYGVAGIPGTSAHAQAVSTQNGWKALTVVRWEMLLAISVAVTSVAVHRSRPSRHVIALTRLALLGLGALTAALLTVRVLIDLPSPADVVDQKLGAVLGVVAAYGIALGGLEAIREQRARSRAAVQASRS